MFSFFLFHFLSSMYWIKGTSTSSPSVLLQQTSKTRARCQAGICFPVTISTSCGIFIFLRSFCLSFGMKKANSMATPALSIVISKLCSLLKLSISSPSVGSPEITKRSHKVQGLPLYSAFLGGTGSEKAKKGNARFKNPFLYFSTFLWPWTTLNNSKQTKPTTKLVVVAMAGIIRPAMSLLCKKRR